MPDICCSRERCQRAEREDVGHAARQGGDGLIEVRRHTVPHFGESLGLVGSKGCGPRGKGVDGAVAGGLTIESRRVAGAELELGLDEVRGIGHRLLVALKTVHVEGHGDLRIVRGGAGEDIGVPPFVVGARAKGRRSEGIGGTAL